MDSRVWIFIAIFYLVKTQDDGFTDENRPYEFGFNIEGYQHRHEKKDEKGIIMGEFGFITADGVYHLTVYATDENGNFKILKMKNIKIGLPMDKMMTTEPAIAKIGHQNNLGIRKEETTTKLNGKQGCSGCLIPTTSKPLREIVGKNQLPISGVGGLNINKNGYIDKGNANQINSNPVQNVFSNDGLINKNSFKNIQNNQNNFVLNPDVNKNIQNPPSATFRSTLSSNSDLGIPPTSLKRKVDTNLQNVLPDPISPQSLFPNNINSNGGSYNKKNNKLDNDIPSGIKMEDLMAMLYKFNYTLSFHGHHETGDRGGNKKGDFFFNGRDGFQRNVNYIANEFGYQPNISLINIGLESPDTPKEDSEKQLNELKGNEFKWFYSRK